MLPSGAYDHKQFEKDVLNFWLQGNYYRPEYNPITDSLQSTEEMKADSRKPWCLVCPPPNAYGRPHIGNISGYAYMDAMARYQRMNGKKVLVLPGKDHAGLEGEGVFVREVLEKQGRNKFDMKREEFYQEMLDFNYVNMEKAMQDEKNIGLSADFERNTFTLDPDIVDTVLDTFVEMYKQDMIYKGVRIVNWDPKARSVIADNQCIREEREGSLYYIKYKLTEPVDGVEYITVATTRPETMFGDTAVAVNPKDKRFNHLIGKKVSIPLTKIEIPVISSFRVLEDFGTGALKITPAHSQDDYQIMMEWNKENQDSIEKQIGYQNVINKNLILVGVTPEKYKNRKYKEAREEIINDLKTAGLLEKEEKVQQNVLISERTKALVEPLMSSQWYLRYDKIKDEAKAMVNDGRIKLHPESMVDKFNFWMDNLRDWAISRSLWWGYRLPVWYKGEVKEEIGDNGEVKEYINVGSDTNENWVPLEYGNENHIRIQKQNPGEGWRQDEDVLDTWFSSGQWVYASLKKYDLMDTFFPTDVMVSGFDILENWISRMIMFTYFHEKKEPFKNVYLTGLVLGTDGQKMSKSKKNVIDIDDIIRDYGTDSLRLAYFYQNSAGASYAMTFEKLKNFKGFLNKIWNASKYVLNNEQYVIKDFDVANVKHDFSKKILEHMSEVNVHITENIEKFQLGLATFNLYQEFWHTYCDILIEESKEYLWDKKDKDSGAILSSPDSEVRTEVATVMTMALKSYLKLLHPFIPFITQTIWNEVPKNDTETSVLMYNAWEVK